MPKTLAYKTKISKNLINCKFCNKEFLRESTLSVHLCEPARRHRQRNETGVQFGYRTWMKFLQANSTKQGLTYDDFVASPFYSAFVKFGQYMVQIRCVNVEAFSDYILQSKIKIDRWCRDEHYTVWLVEYIKREPADRAVERSIQTMTAWSESTNKDFNLYFTQASANLITSDIVNGRISPWVVYQSDTGKEFLSTATVEQLGLLFAFIDPGWWTSRFSNLTEDVEFVKMICANGKF
jgi:hypothetical protein